MISELETKELFLRDPLSVNHMQPSQLKVLQKCVQKSKKKRPLSAYNVFVKQQLQLINSTDKATMRPREKIKIISDKWKTLKENQNGEC